MRNSGGSNTPGSATTPLNNGQGGGSGNTPGITKDGNNGNNATPPNGAGVNTPQCQGVIGGGAAPANSAGAAEVVPKVNTGGDVSQSFLQKVVGLFR